MKFEEVLAKLNNHIALIIGILTLPSLLYGDYCWYNSQIHTHQLDGEWKFTFAIQSSSMKAYVGKSAGYKLYIQQNGNIVNGKGEKWWIDDKEIPYSQHDRLEFVGSLNEETVTANYTLYGTKRTSTGTFNIKLNEDNNMEGGFSGTAANTQGRLLANKAGM